MTGTDRTFRPMPTSLATLAALVAILAATSTLPEGAVLERSRSWIIRPIDGDDTGPGAGRTLSDCLAQAARHLLGAKVHFSTAIAPLHSPRVTNPESPTLRAPAAHLVWSATQRVVVSHLALPPPLA